MNELTLSQ